MDRRAGEPHGIPAPGFRLPAGTRPGRVRLRVSSLERSLAFYGDVLGFRAIEGSETHALLVAGGDGRNGASGGDGEPLVELHSEPGIRPVPPDGHFGLFHFAVLLPDRVALGRFLSHLRRSGVGPGMSDHAVSEALYLSDPDGLGIEVYADRPREEWSYGGRDDRELRMTTAPMDVEGVLRAARGEPWRGMPEGTRIGHLHFRVGNLEAGAEFYHDALGLDLTVWSYPGALFFSAGGYHHHVGINTWAGADIGPPRLDEACLLDWELVMPDAESAEAALRSLERSGHPARLSAAGAGESGAGAASSIESEGVVADPWGTEVRIVPDRSSSVPR